jgi:hypothetical protein
MTILAIVIVLDLPRWRRRPTTSSPDAETRFPDRGWKGGPDADGSRQARAMVQTEKVATRLGGKVLLVEGLRRSDDGRSRSGA